MTPCRSWSPICTSRSGPRSRPASLTRSPSLTRCTSPWPRTAARTKTRRRVQDEQLAHRGRAGEPLYGARKLLMVGAEHLDQRARRRLDVLLAFGDPDGRVFEAWRAKEAVRDLYTMWAQPELAAVWIDAVIDDSRHSNVPEIKSLGRTLKQWRTAILAWHTTGASNGPTEGLNSVIKKIKRVAAGFRNFAHYRTRILLAVGGCNWSLLATTPR
jgi:transposase